MEINSTSSMVQEYLIALKNQQSKTTTKSFEDEMNHNISTNRTQSTSIVNTNSEDTKERFHEVYTYENTKGMSEDDIDTYFSNKTEEQRGQIKAVVRMANNFSENDAANEAVFNEFKNHPQDMGVGSMKSMNFFMEKDNYLLGHPTLANVLVVSSEYVAAKQAGVDNPEAQGIFMNAAHKARYESGNNTISFNTKFTSKQADDFLETMTKLAKDKMDQARGTQVFDDYKEAYERYDRMNSDYNNILEKRK